MGRDALGARAPSRVQEMGLQGLLEEAGMGGVLGICGVPSTSLWVVVMASAAGVAVVDVAAQTAALAQARTSVVPQRVRHLLGSTWQRVRSGLGTSAVVRAANASPKEAWSTRSSRYAGSVALPDRCIMVARWQTLEKWRVHSSGAFLVWKWTDMRSRLCEGVSADGEEAVEVLAIRHAGGHVIAVFFAITGDLASAHLGHGERWEKRPRTGVPLSAALFVALVSVAADEAPPAAVESVAALGNTYVRQEWELRERYHYEYGDQYAYVLAPNGALLQWHSLVPGLAADEQVYGAVTGWAVLPGSSTDAPSPLIGFGALPPGGGVWGVRENAVVEVLLPPAPAPLGPLSATGAAAQPTTLLQTAFLLFASGAQRAAQATLRYGAGVLTCATVNEAVCRLGQRLTERLDDVDLEGSPPESQLAWRCHLLRRLYAFTVECETGLGDAEHVHQRVVDALTEESLVQLLRYAQQVNAALAVARLRNRMSSAGGSVLGQQVLPAADRAEGDWAGQIVEVVERLQMRWEAQPRSLHPHGAMSPPEHDHEYVQTAEVAARLVLDGVVGPRTQLPEWAAVSSVETTAAEWLITSTSVLMQLLQVLVQQLPERLVGQGAQQREAVMNTGESLLRAWMECQRLVNVDDGDTAGTPVLLRLFSGGWAEVAIRLAMEYGRFGALMAMADAAAADTDTDALVDACLNAFGRPFADFAYQWWSARRNEQAMLRHAREYLRPWLRQHEEERRRLLWLADILAAEYEAAVQHLLECEASAEVSVEHSEVLLALALLCGKVSDPPSAAEEAQLARRRLRTQAFAHLGLEHFRSTESLVSWFAQGDGGGSLTSLGDDALALLRLLDAERACSLYAPVYGALVGRERHLWERLREHGAAMSDAETDTLLKQTALYRVLRQRGTAEGRTAADVDALVAAYPQYEPHLRAAMRETPAAPVTSTE
ncbi:hypothetical protein CDCA_CDCA10G2963 [Cyanidium caldarium]|uniref:Uncharacterized protein n=1 Tax=Cyanidium caldarium TaxID=2771 RepID=A0AAV9IXA6_CYACA|nr:hypothetical protein CDCA_CDCA10G2963 [Cyanidium caldarium]